MAADYTSYSFQPALLFFFFFFFPPFFFFSFLFFPPVLFLFIRTFLTSQIWLTFDLHWILLSRKAKTIPSNVKLCCFSLYLCVGYFLCTCASVFLLGRGRGGGFKHGGFIENKILILYGIWWQSVKGSVLIISELWVQINSVYDRPFFLQAYSWN